MKQIKIHLFENIEKFFRLYRAADGFKTKKFVWQKFRIEKCLIYYYSYKKNELSKIIDGRRYLSPCPILKCFLL